ncbi:hypothetical protein Bca52824_041471 [Brassica carinata]|uniref:Uncharacterized protein n=1 Tax=Brassica carinata TaxID=52824 RepID=A0A8X7RVH5_BRACI|nr:hypothetical protein Bca52824_041471 [Brassica carinata]
MVLAGDRCWYFPFPLAFRLGLMYEGPLGKLFALVARRRRRHETASQSSGREFVFADLERVSGEI